MADLKPDARSAVVTLTHDPKLDDPALDAALRSQAFYIGALGSRRTHAKRVARLKDLGHGDDAIARIHAPVGLDIEAVTAPEIALSVMAEIVAARRGAALGAAASPSRAAGRPRQHRHLRMIFGPTPLDEAKGAILAHSLRLSGRGAEEGHGAG